MVNTGHSVAIVVATSVDNDQSTQSALTLIQESIKLTIEISISEM